MVTKLRPILFASLGLLLCACAGEANYPEGGGDEPQAEVAVTAAPPPAQVEVVPAAPAVGYVWTPGYWGWNGRSYAWVGGRYVVGRAGYTWAAPRYVYRGGRHYWYRGGWVRARRY